MDYLAAKAIISGILIAAASETSAIVKAARSSRVSNDLDLCERRMAGA
jgi:hypothetical protein